MELLYKIKRHKGIYLGFYSKDLETQLETAPLVIPREHGIKVFCGQIVYSEKKQKEIIKSIVKDFTQIIEKYISDKDFWKITIQILIENACKHNIISTTDPLSINVVIDNNKVIVSNNIAPRPIPADSTGLGLKGLKEKYKIIANKKIEIKQTDTTFSVAVPLMTRHEIE